MIFCCWYTTLCCTIIIHGILPCRSILVKDGIGGMGLVKNSHCLMAGQLHGSFEVFSTAKSLPPSSQLDGRYQLWVETLQSSFLLENLLWSARNTVGYKNKHLFTFLALFVSASGSYGEDRPVGTMTTHQTQSNSALYQWLSNSVQKWVPFINHRESCVSGQNVTNKRPTTETLPTGWGNIFTIGFGRRSFDD